MDNIPAMIDYVEFLILGTNMTGHHIVLDALFHTGTPELLSLLVSWKPSGLQKMGMYGPITEPGAVQPREHKVSLVDLFPGMVLSELHPNSSAPNHSVGRSLFSRQDKVKTGKE